MLFGKFTNAGNLILLTPYLAKKFNLGLVSGSEKEKTSDGSGARERGGRVVKTMGTIFSSPQKTRPAFIHAVEYGNFLSQEDVLRLGVTSKEVAGTLNWAIYGGTKTHGRSQTGRADLSSHSRDLDGQSLSHREQRMRSVV